MTNQKCPLVDRESTAGANTGRLHHTSPFPRCQLHDVRIVDGLPSQCAIGLSNPFDGIRAYRDRGWNRIGRADGDTEGGLLDLRRADVCGGCIGRLSAHRHVRRLRRLAGLEAVT